MQKRKVLWIEDGALGDFDELLGPVNIDGSYDLSIALDASQGIEFIMQTEFDAVIVDIRLPPGDDKQWQRIYYSPETNKDAARLGLLVLRSLLPSKTGKINEVKFKSIPDWIRAEKFGVLTVENQGEVMKDLQDLSISMRAYRQKNINPSDTVLLELIEIVLNQSIK